jgi:hypothetical protein
VGSNSVLLDLRVKVDQVTLGSAKQDGFAQEISIKIKKPILLHSRSMKAKLGFDRSTGLAARFRKRPPVRIGSRHKCLYEDCFMGRTAPLHLASTPIGGTSL